MRRRAGSLLRAFAVPLAVLLAWDLACRAGLFSPLILPSPGQVVRRWVAYASPLSPYDPAQGSYLAWLASGELWGDAAGSLYRVVLGFLLGAGLALPLGLLMGARTSIYELLNPLLQVLRPIPPIAFIPLAILWFGLGNPPAFFLIALGTFFPVLVNTVAGVRNVDGIYLRAARNLGAGELTVFRRVMLPGAMPYVLAGMRVGIGIAFIVVIVAEMTAVNRGLGYRILEAREYFWSDKIIAGMITIGLIGLAIDGLMGRLNARMLRWRRGIEE
jgi:NitT/TauT family transport system permease protein